MASSTFETHKARLDDACAFLRSFTLGRRGFTLRDAAVGIERVDSECEGLKRFLASGPTAKEAATLVAAARANVMAAKARVALLTKEQG
jgi:hypothetical protein